MLHSAITALNQHTWDYHILSSFLTVSQVLRSLTAKWPQNRKVTGAMKHVNNDLKFIICYSSSKFTKLIQDKYTVGYNMCKNLKLIFLYSHQTTMFGSAVILCGEFRCF